jgi:hypothetical protein
MKVLKGIVIRLEHKLCVYQYYWDWALWIAKQPNRPLTQSEDLVRLKGNLGQGFDVAVVELSSYI